MGTMSRLLLAPLLAVISLSAAAAFTPPIVRGDLVFDGIPERVSENADTLDAYLGARQATPLGFSPKGQLLIATRFGDVEQLHVVDHAGGERRQLTFLREPIVRGEYSPDPNRNAFFYVTDAAGDGNTQIYYQRVGEIAPRRLTDGKSRNTAAIWSNGGREIAYATTARDGAAYDIDIVEPETGALPHLAVTGDGTAWLPLDFSPDDRKLLVLKHVSSAEDYLYVVDLATGQKREVEPSPSKVAIAGARFSRDGTGVYLVSDKDGEYARLHYVNVFTGEKTDISGRIPFDIESFALSRDGHYLAYVVNEAGTGKLNLTDLRSHQDLNPPKLPLAGVIDSLSFDAESKLLAFGFAAANQPRDAYVLDVAANRLEAWTQSEAGPMDRAKLAVPRLAQFPTFDRADGKPRPLPVYIYEPAAGGPHPVLILLHDGPAGEFRPSFDPWIQYVVGELGFSVVAPNLRGSSGYGRTFASLTRGSSREDALKDIGALLVWLGHDNRFDAKRVVVAGRGYGGYLALAALMNYGDRLKGGVAVSAVTDFIGFLEGTAPYLKLSEREELGDERDSDTRAFLRRISPLTGAERITRPLLLVSGKNDPRVPLAQTEEIVNRLRGRAPAPWYLKANDEGGDFAKWQNREAYYRVFAEFLTTLK
jgi:dipeptidyl aminopeptidase/acylaminoacyl peptidase